MKKKSLLKRILGGTISAIMALTPLAAFADNGSGLPAYGTWGDALYSDIAAYVNHCPINSYSCEGKTVVVAEDLRCYGYDVVWDNNSRLLAVDPSASVSSIGGDSTVYRHGDKLNRVFAYVVPSDICVYVCGVYIPSYCIDGYTMIALEDLAAASGCDFTWDQSTRSAKLWIGWAPMYTYVVVPEESSEVSDVTSATTPTYTVSATTSSTDSSIKGIYKNGEIYVGVNEYTSADITNSDPAFFMYTMAKPTLNAKGTLNDVDIYEGELYLYTPDGSILTENAHGTYTVTIGGVSYAATFGDKNLTLSGDGSYAGTYKQISNTGANVGAEAWYDYDEFSSTSTGSTIEGVYYAYVKYSNKDVNNRIAILNITYVDDSTIRVEYSRKNAPEDYVNMDFHLQSDGTYKAEGDGGLDGYSARYIITPIDSESVMFTRSGYRGETQFSEELEFIK